jgi:2-methylaconitate cis-trans-isomerase PrpF
LTGIEIDEIDTGDEIKRTLETIRCKAAIMVGLCASEQEATQRSQAVPKIAFIAPPKPYTTTGGQTVTAQDIDITARIMSMGTLNRSYAVSGGISTAGAAMIPGTVAYDLISKEARRNDLLRIGHPGGVINIGAAIDMDGDCCVYRQAIVKVKGHILNFKYLFLVISPVDHMIIRTRVFNAQRACHLVCLYFRF